MNSRPPRRAGAPTPPKPAARLTPAVLLEHDLADDATFQRLSFDLDLSGRAARLVEFEQCVFRDADLTGTVLERARFDDCRFERTNLANLRAEKSSMLRGELTGARLTGLQWIDGVLRDLRVSGCRGDLSGFRFTGFQQVVFEDCNLSGADFQNADLGGAQFVGCDLTGAQFSFASMRGTRFQGCVLDGISGVTSFQGAIVAGPDLIALSHTLAAGLGIQIEDADS